MNARTHKRYAVIGLGLVVLAALAVAGFQSGFLEGIAEKPGESFAPPGDFLVTKTETRKVSGFSVTDIEAEDEDSKLRLEFTRGMDAKLAQLYLEEKRQGIESLFVTQPAHYPGIITREVNCPARFQPEQGELGGMTYYIMYANSRFSYGICADEFVAYRSVVGLAYCAEQKTFIEAEFFSSPDLFDADRALGFLSSLSCR